MADKIFDTADPEAGGGGVGSDGGGTGDKAAASDSHSEGKPKVAFVDDVKISKHEIESMKRQMAEQQRLIAKELERKEADDFEAELGRMLQNENATARKDPKNMFLLNQKRQ